VTHDPTVASYADQVVFLNDGRIVDEMSAPTAASVLDRLLSLEGEPTAAGTRRAG
jgi:putative ABC transport system ATP-binding protein